MSGGSGENPANGRAGSRLIVKVGLDRRGRWTVELPDKRGIGSCETLDDARRVAYLHAARRRCWELVVRDSYNRVVQHEVVDGV